MDQFVLIIEDDEKNQETLFNVLKKINPNLKVRFFDKLELFSKWVGLLIKDGPQVLDLAGKRWKNDQIPETQSQEKNVNLVIGKNEILGNQIVPLFNKTLELFIRKNLCTEEEKTSFVITAFDNAELNLKNIEVRFINNLIFKPFDLLILEEHLSYAVIGRKKPKNQNLKNNKMSAQVEMIKDIPVLGFSDIGFLSSNDRPLVIGEIGKYYGEEFKVGHLKSTLARCVKSEADPENPNKYLCWMEYFAMENEQIKKTRKDFIVDYPVGLMNKPEMSLKINILFFNSYEDNDLSASIKRFYPSVDIYSYKKWEDFEFDFNPEKSEFIVDKDLPTDSQISINLDPSGHYFIDFSDIPEGEKIFGETVNSLKSKDFHQLLEPESKKKWFEVFRTLKVLPDKEPVLVIQNNNKKYIFKLLTLKKELTKSGLPSLFLKLAKLSAAEKSTFLKSMTLLPKKIDLIIGSEVFFSNCVKKKYYEKEQKILLSKRIFTDVEEKDWSEQVKDILYLPLDKVYLAKKIFVLFFEIAQWRPSHFVQKTKEIQTAQQVQLDEISEAGLIFKYHRPLSVGSFRKFYLWTPNETELLDYLANCNYTEELKDQKGIFLHHFVFFGMRDIFLKNIRLWVRENYIQNKSKGE